MVVPAQTCHLGSSLSGQNQKLRGTAGIHDRFIHFEERKAAFQRLAHHYQQLFQHFPMSEPQNTVIGL